MILRRVCLVAGSIADGCLFFPQRSKIYLNSSATWLQWSRGWYPGCYLRGRPRASESERFNGAGVGTPVVTRKLFPPCFYRVFKVLFREPLFFGVFSTLSNRRKKRKGLQRQCRESAGVFTSAWGSRVAVPMLHAPVPERRGRGRNDRARPMKNSPPWVRRTGRESRIRERPALPSGCV